MMFPTPDLTPPPDSGSVCCMTDIWWSTVRYRRHVRDATVRCLPFRYSICSTVEACVPPYWYSVFCRDDVRLNTCDDALLLTPASYAWPMRCLAATCCLTGVCVPWHLLFIYRCLLFGCLFCDHPGMSAVILCRLRVTPVPTHIVMRWLVWPFFALSADTCCWPVFFCVRYTTCHDGTRIPFQYSAALFVRCRRTLYDRLDGVIWPRQGYDWYFPLLSTCWLYDCYRPSNYPSILTNNLLELTLHMMFLLRDICGTTRQHDSIRPFIPPLYWWLRIFLRHDVTIRYSCTCTVRLPVILSQLLLLLGYDKILLPRGRDRQRTATLYSGIFYCYGVVY